MGVLKDEYYPHYTYEEYMLWEGDRELIAGIPYAMTPAPMIKHQKISNRIARYLDEALQECETCQALLLIDWKISEHTVVQPDNLVICHTPRNEAYITETPTVIFEVLSKSTADKDRNLKYHHYEQEGVGYYVIVDPDEELAKIYRLKDGHYIKVSDTHDSSIDFNLETFSFSFNFSKIW